MSRPSTLLVSAIIVMTVAVCPGRAASDLAGRVLFSGLGVPGAIVTATRGDRSVSTVSDEGGAFRFADQDDGTWTIRVEMSGFVAMSRDVTLPRPTDAEPLTFTLTMRPYAEIVAIAPAPAAAAVVPPTSPAAVAAEPDQVDVITGSVVNGATTQYAQPRAFGNNRPRASALYNFAGTAVIGNSAWNSPPYSFIGSTTPAPTYGDLQLGFNLAGPLRIPWLVKYGPSMALGYQHGSTHHATTLSAVVPTAAERAGDFSASATSIRDPNTGQAFAGNVIPTGRITSQAASLLRYYPLPTTDDATGPNFQRAVLTSTTSDRLQFGMNKSWRNRVSMDGTIAWQRLSTDSSNIFGFEDTSLASSVNATLNVSRQYSARLVLHARYQFTRAASSLTPFFAGRTNVSGEAGISGNDQDPSNWGPPTLSLPGIAGLFDGNAQRTVNTTHAPGGEVLLRHGAHNITMGGDFRWNLADYSEQPEPRGTITFTGSASGNALADFLMGVPGASSIAYGNTSTHLRGVSPDAYVNDDWRALANLTLNFGVRWEYDSPFTETSGRLANLDVAPGFTAISPVLATSPVGSLTGASYPTSLIRPDKRGIEPRVGLSWRPSLSSSTVFKASYGLYRNLGGYQSLALLLSQQVPFAKTFNLQNTAETPLSLANPFPSSLSTTPNTFAIDPDFRASYLHAWQVSMQRELPASLTVIAAYLGAKGSHLMQAFLPNTQAPGSVEATPNPSGFIYVTSNGSSLRNAAQFTLRRRLYAGLMASVQYTLAKSTDDAATFSNGAITPAALSIAQDWLDLNAERGPSSFDQRHHIDALFQYTTGVGLKGGTLVDGFWGSLWKDWTVAMQLGAGTGMPFTPVSFLSVSGTGVVGIRPALTGASTTPIEAGSYANPAAFVTPPPGVWGNAGRNSLRGPAQFTLDMSVSRVFRFGNRLNAEWRVAATNVLNRVTFTTVDDIVGSPQFGLPTFANPMRALQMTMRVRF
jgi:hypothetical protein